MFQGKKRKKILLIIAILIITLTGTGIVIWKINSNKNENNNQEILEELDFTSKRLVITTDIEIEIDEAYNAKSINKTYSGKYVVRYETEEETKSAYENFKKDSRIQQVDIDVNVKLQNANALTIIHNIAGYDLESWGVYTVGLNETQDMINNKATNEEIVVAVLDSGFDLSNTMLDEQNLRTRIDTRYKNVTDNSTDISDKNYIVDEETGEEFLIGHGTHVGGIILDGTPDNVKILPIKIEDEDGNIGLIYIYDAIRYAIDQEVDIMNFSLGWANNSNTDLITEEIHKLIEEANEKGIIMVAAVGNGDSAGIRIDGSNIYPAAYEEVMGVAALETDQITIENNIIDLEVLQSYKNAKNSTIENLSYTSFSNYGTTVDFSAPGHYILSLLPLDSAMGVPLLSGTSQASPHMAAMVATIKSYNLDWNAIEIEKVLKYYTKDLGTTGRDQDYGEGVVSFKNFVECTCGSEECYEIYCFGCLGEGCLYHEEMKKTLESIAITTEPLKTIYKEGEIFNPAGMVVTATYNDSITAEVTNYTYAPDRQLEISDTTITISYTEDEITKTATQGITVNAIEKILENIEITTKPSKTKYEEGENFNPAGMVVTAVYSDNSREIVTDYAYSPTGALSTSDTKITITYQGKTAEITIVVNKKVVEQPEVTLRRIEITTKPTKTTYEVGEKFDPSGMVVTATYSDGTSKIISNYNCFPVAELTTNNKKITVTYTENGVSVSTTIDIIVNSKEVVNNNSNNNNSNNNNNNNNNQSGNNGAADKDKNYVEIKNDTTVINVVDNTIKNQNLANTGTETYIIPIIMITVVGIVAFIKYRQYKDV